jgi:hypothetical protein
MGCGYPFEEGRDYVIFASRNKDGAVEITPCNMDIWPLARAEAADVLGFLDSLEKPATGGRIFGEVMLVTRSFTEAEVAPEPVDGTLVFLSGGGIQWQTTVVAGRYEFSGLSAGTYEVSVDVPKGMPAAFSVRPPEGSPPFEKLVREERLYKRSVTIAHARSCGYAPFAAMFDGRLTGVVVNADGSPARGIDVEAVPIEIDTRRSEYFGAIGTTGDEGKYEIRGLAPGRYTVGVNLRDVVKGWAPYPAVAVTRDGVREPEPVELSTGERRELPPLRLPPKVVKHRLSGIVEWSDRRPLGRVSLVISEADRGAANSHVLTTYTEADGTFSIELFEGRTYDLRARELEPGRRSRQPGTAEPYELGAGTMTFTLLGDPRALRVVLTPANKE